MRTSKFLNLDENVLLEWIYDDDNLLIEDYKVVVNTISEQRNFINANATNTIASSTNNTQPYSLIEINNENNRWGYMNETIYPFLQVSSYSGNIPQRYDVVKIHFPVNYTFDDKLGFLINVSVLDSSGKTRYFLSDYFFDKSDTSRSLDLTAPPFLYRDVLWGKYIQLQVPAASVLSKQLTQGSTGVTTLVPTPGSINANLAGLGNFGVGANSPIFVEFSFLLKKDIMFGQTSFLIQTPYTTSIPQVPEFEDLSTSITNSDQGDFFEIVGIYNNTASEFQTFIDQQKSIGNTFYVTYTITTIEKNIVTNTVSYFVEDDFNESIWYRPIISFSTTTAALDVNMKLVNANDGNFIERSATYTMLQDEVAKYSRNLTKINVDNAFKSIIYNADADQLTVKQYGDSSIQYEKIDVPFPVMFDRYSIIAKNNTEDIQGETYYGIGQLQILLYPFDNIIKLVIAKSSQDDQIIPYSIPDGSKVTMTFKSSTDVVDSELYYDSNEIDLENGQLIFRVTQDQVTTITEFFKLGYDQFYVVFKPDTGIDTIIYAGRYLIYNEY